MRSLRNAIADAPGPALGLFVKIPAFEVVEIIGRAGYDFVVIDTEHAPLSVRDVYEMVVAYSGLGVVPLVRVTDHSYGDAQRYLDAGAAGILVPHVSTREQAAAVAQQLRFPPLGSRGMGFASRAGEWGGLPGGADEYLRQGQDEVVRIAMVEDSAAVENIGGIVSTDGIDAIFVGSGDLSVSLGVPMGSPQVVQAVDRAVEEGVRSGVLTGTIVGSAEEARRRASQGCAFLMVGNDTGLLRKAVLANLSACREAVNDLGDARGGSR